MSQLERQKSQETTATGVTTTSAATQSTEETTQTKATQQTGKQQEKKEEAEKKKEEEKKEEEKTYIVVQQYQDEEKINLNILTSTALLSLQFILGIIYLASVCQAPCAASIAYTLNIAALWGSFIIEVFWAFIFFFSDQSLDVNSIIASNFCTCVLSLIFALIFTHVDNSIKKDLHRRKKSMQTVNIVLLIVDVLLFLLIMSEFLKEDF